MKSKRPHNQNVLQAEALCQESIPPLSSPPPLPVGVGGSQRTLHPCQALGRSN